MSLPGTLVSGLEKEQKVGAEGVGCKSTGTACTLSTCHMHGQVCILLGADPGAQHPLPVSVVGSDTRATLTGSGVALSLGSDGEKPREASDHQTPKSAVNMVQAQERESWGLFGGKATCLWGS